VVQASQAAATRVDSAVGREECAHLKSLKSADGANRRRPDEAVDGELGRGAAPRGWHGIEQGLHLAHIGGKIAAAAANAGAEGLVHGGFLEVELRSP
jgi:hypothetical protein